MGKANPAINAADVNGLGDTTPLTGTGGAPSTSKGKLS